MKSRAWARDVLRRAKELPPGGHMLDIDAVQEAEEILREEIPPKKDIGWHQFDIYAMEQQEEQADKCLKILVGLILCVIIYYSTA